MQPFGPDRDLKERIKHANDIVDVVGQYMQLRRQGAHWVGHCLWHEDRRPSLQVNQVRQSWVCWVCNIRGDVFDFVMRKENVEFVEALEILAQRAGIPLTRAQQKIRKGSAQDKQTLYAACNWAEQQFHQLLLKSDGGSLAREYLAERGITQECIDAFQIGFAPNSFTWLADRARSTAYSLEVLEACDLVRPRSNGGWYDAFRGRVIFPIRDTQSRAIAFGGRVVPGLVPEEQQSPAKYLNSKETRLFSKSDMLYGLNLLSDEARRARKLTIVEGYTDVVAAWQSGLRNVVAALGTALNERHIRLLKRYADEITLVLDGDDAGQRRANEILDLFVASDIDLRILTLPERLDPFDFLIKNGKEPFQSMIDQAPDAIEHKIRVETDGLDLINNTHGANRALERVLETLARLPSSIFSGSVSKVLRQDQLLMRLARKFSLDHEQIRARLLELRTSLHRRQRYHAPPPAEEPQALDPAKLDHKERELIELIFLDPALVDIAIENVSPGQLTPGPLRAVYEIVVECFHDGEEVGFEDVILRVDEPNIKSLLLHVKEEADQKQETQQTQSEFLIQKQTQLELVIQAFNDIHEEAQKRTAISRLQQGMDDQQELSTLEQLLEKARSRHGE